MSAEYMREYRERRKFLGTTAIDQRRRSGDRHTDPDRNRGRKTNPSRDRGKKATKSSRAWVVAWDGEAVTLHTELGTVHKYVLLANSEGRRIVDVHGLSTRACLEFLCAEGKTARKAIHTIFGGGYDVNMILGDLPRSKVEELWKMGYVEWEEFRIWYTKRKEFRVHQLGETRFRFDQRRNKYVPNVVGGITIWDSFGFSQCRFTKAVEQWIGDVPEMAFLVEMKEARSSFSESDVAEMVRYNDIECRYLKQISEAILAAHKEAGITLNRFDGAGASATGLLRNHRIHSYMSEEPYDVRIAAQHAYAGGRIEAIRLGNHEGESLVYKYDINSAYPHAVTLLPCLAHGEWQSVESPGTTLGLFTVYRARWDFTGQPFYPFFYRQSDATIIFPSQGEGWYWAPEIHSAIRNGNDVDLEAAFTYTTSCDCAPFSWLPDVYELRQRYKDEGKHAQYALKLAMNSVYGKFIQQAGWKRNNQRRPTYHQLSWGGWVTSLCRARMYDIAMRDPDSVIMFATDGLFTTEPRDVPVSDDLGEWSYEELDGITVVQPGVYWYRKVGTVDCLYGCDEGCTTPDHRWHHRFRGFDPSSLERNKVLATWKKKGSYTGTVTRFVGAGSALVSDEWWDRWRTWHTADRQLDIYPTGKRLAIGKPLYHRALQRTMAMDNLTPDVMSTPYPIAWFENRDEDNQLEGVPLKVVEEEWEDALL